MGLCWLNEHLSDALLYFQASAIVVFCEVSGVKRLLKMAATGDSLHCTAEGTPGSAGLSGENGGFPG